MDKEQQLLNEKLDLIIRLLSLGVVQGKPQREQIGILSLAGLKPKSIATLLNTTPNTVSVEWRALRKSGWKLGVTRKGA